MLSIKPATFYLKAFCCYSIKVVLETIRNQKRSFKTVYIKAGYCVCAGVHFDALALHIKYKYVHINISKDLLSGKQQQQQQQLAIAFLEEESGSS